jgi:hypothetical protein
LTADTRTRIEIRGIVRVKIIILLTVGVDSEVLSRTSTSSRQRPATVEERE